MTLCKTMQLPIHDGDEPRSSLLVAISHLLEQQRHVRGLGFHAGPPCTGCAKKIVNCTLQVASAELRSANSPLMSPLRQKRRVSSIEEPNQLSTLAHSKAARRPGWVLKIRYSMRR